VKRAGRRKRQPDLALDQALDSEVRRVDTDRWLASRFASGGARARLIAVYALNHEIARSAEIVREPAIGDIRLEWWREALAELFAGAAPRAHPVLIAVSAAHAATPLPHAVIERLIQARGRDLDPAPFEGWAELDAYVEATAGGVIRLALCASGAASGACEALIPHAARAWGYVGLLRASGRVVAMGQGAREEALGRVGAAYANVRKEARLDAGAFGALGYLALVPHYLHALQIGARDVALLRRQVTLIGAVASGRL